MQVNEAFCGVNSKSASLGAMGLTGFINPGIGIIKSWQGITEIAIRAALIVRL